MGGGFRPAPGVDMSQPISSPSLFRRLYKYLKPDWAFGLNAVIGLAVLFLEASDPTEFMIARSSPILIIATAIGATIILAFIATFMATLDRHKLDEYHYQIIANGAIIAVLTAIFINMIWLIAAPALGSMTAQLMVGVLLLAWSFGYFFGRIKGVK